jgi:AraC-like DNA-binding protein/tetratricopeptide (TPR) repeat protein
VRILSEAPGTVKAKADELVYKARQWTQERVLWDWDAASDEVKPLLAEIQRRLFDPAFNVAALERSCRVTQRIRRLFRAELGTTIKKYLTRRKMETIRWLLENSDLEMRVIAEAFGYSDPTNFSRDFTAWAKRTPTAVRSAVRPILPPGRWPEAFPELSRVSLDDRPAGESLRTLDGLLRRRVVAIGGRPGKDFEAMEEHMASAVWEVLEGASPGERQHLVRETFRFRSPALFELLSTKSRELGRKDRQRGVELAELALASLDGSAVLLGGRVVELRALGRARLANALLLACDLKEAERAMLRADSEWATPRRERDHRVETEILFLKGTLRFFQRRLQEAKELLDEAIALGRAFDFDRLLVQSLLQRVAVMRYTGEPETALLRDLYQAARLLEGQGESFLAAGIQQELALVLCQIGDYAKAEESLTVAKELCRSLALTGNQHQLEWIEGLILSGLGELEAAAGSLHSAHAGFLQTGDYIAAAIVALDHAALCLRQGRHGEALSLASEAVPILSDSGLHPEAIGCADLLRSAIATRRITRTVLEEARRYLRAMQHRRGSCRD